MCYNSVGRMITSGPSCALETGGYGVGQIYSKTSTLLLPYHVLLGTMFTFFEIQFPGIDNPS